MFGHRGDLEGFGFTIDAIDFNLYRIRMAATGESCGNFCGEFVIFLIAYLAIDQGQRLIITYQTQLDAETQDMLFLDNITAATQWFNGESSEPGRLTFTRTLSDGTTGTPDHEDVHTVETQVP